MADDWEENDDWEAAAENFKPAAAVAPSKPAQEFETKGQAILAGAAEPDMSKFADEDAEQEEQPKHKVVPPQPKKKEEKKYERSTLPVDKPLDDPIAEKLRQQRLIEQSDLAAAKELFGADDGGVNLGTFLPKSVKDFDDVANTIANRYVLPHTDSKNYKAFLKSLIKAVMAPLPSQEIKDLETCVAGVRADKVKAEQAAAAAKSAKGKKTLNVGRGGGAAGLDDYVYADNGDTDDYDFM